MSIEVMKMALDALEQLQGGCTDSDDGTVEAITVWCPEVIDALRQAIEQAEHVHAVNTSQEHVDETAKGEHEPAAFECPRCGHCCRPEWVGLTDDEVSEVIDNVLEGGGWLDVARALEAAIKEKNT